MANGALAHIRVLDLSRVLAGPWATQALADLGADVIKVERPGTGDDTRGWGPPWLREDAGESAYFVSTNRGKRSITVDIARPEGQHIVRRLAAQSDVLVENYKVGALDRYGLGHRPLAALNPRLVYCSITGFGQTGPYRERDRKSTRLNSSHSQISYAVFCLKKKKNRSHTRTRSSGPPNV